MNYNVKTTGYDEYDRTIGNKYRMNSASEIQQAIDFTYINRGIDGKIWKNHNKLEVRNNQVQKVYCISMLIHAYTELRA